MYIPNVRFEVVFKRRHQWTVRTRVVFRSAVDQLMSAETRDDGSLDGFEKLNISYHISYSLDTHGRSCSGRKWISARIRMCLYFVGVSFSFLEERVHYSR